MKIPVAAGLIVLVWSTAIGAQQPLAGKWSGKLTEPGRRSDRPTNVEMEITSAQDGKLKGTMDLYPTSRRSSCAGKYQIEGTFQGNKVEFKSTTVGGFEGCNTQFRLVAEGNQLTGKTDDAEVELSKK